MDFDAQREKAVSLKSIKLPQIIGRCSKRKISLSDVPFPIFSTDHANSIRQSNVQFSKPSIVINELFGKNLRVHHAWECFHRKVIRGQKSEQHSELDPPP
jgi:hypothetical protein